MDIPIHPPDSSSDEASKYNQSLDGDSASSQKPAPEEKTVKTNVDGNNNIINNSDSITYNINNYYGEDGYKKGENPQGSFPPKSSVNINDNLPAWFLSLDEYGKYYALAICFYYGLGLSDFFSVITIIKKHLLKTGVVEKTTSTPLRHPKIDTSEQFDTKRIAKTIKFSNNNTAGEILALAKSEYSALLFSYIPILNEIAESHPNNWELRWRSAAALGQISELDVTYIYRTVINNWINHEKAYMRATVGYYYLYLLDPKNTLIVEAKDFLLKQLDWMSTSKDFTESHWRYKWTTAAICEKIGLLENEDAARLSKQYLEKVAGINHLRVADSVVHALVEWSVKEKFPDAFGLIVNWVEGGSAGSLNEDDPYQIRCIVGLLAFRAVVEINYEFLNEGQDKQDVVFPVDVLKVIWENRLNGKNLWNGAVAIGIRYFEFKNRNLQLGHYFFDMLESWTEIIPDKDFLVEFISAWLEDISHNPRSKTHLQNRLKNVWAKSKNKTLYKISQITLQKIK